MTIDAIRAAVIAALAALCVATGWQLRGWKEDSEDLAVERAATAIVEAARSRESGIAGTVEKRLAELQANHTIIDRGVIRETEKPIYLRVCLEPAAVSLLNAAARGESAGDPAKPAGQVPGAVKPAP